MEKTEDFKWITKEGKKINMVDMDKQYLITIYNRVCLNELEAFNRSNTFSKLRDQIEAVAEQKGIRLEYPDQKFPHYKWGNYFNAVRQTKKTEGSDQNLEIIASALSIKES